MLEKFEVNWYDKCEMVKKEEIAMDIDPMVVLVSVFGVVWLLPTMWEIIESELSARRRRRRQ